MSGCFSCQNRNLVNCPMEMLRKNKTQPPKSILYFRFATSPSILVRRIVLLHKTQLKKFKNCIMQFISWVYIFQYFMKIWGGKIPKMENWEKELMIREQLIEYHFSFFTQFSKIISPWKIYTPGSNWSNFFNETIKSYLAEFPC